MTQQLITLWLFDECIRNLDDLQNQINIIRYKHPSNQILQLAMDRQQDDLDERRAQLNIAMIDIAMRN